MISIIAVRLRWLRRHFSRTHWAARILGLHLPTGEAAEPGLIMIQIDGLASKQLEQALEEGKMPYLSQLIRRRHFTLETFYSGVPSTTPAVQGEIFYGVKAAVPAFQFLHRKSSRVFRMYEADAATEIEADLETKGMEPLLKGGRAYSDIYPAGAELSRYCSRDLTPERIIKRLNPVKCLILIIAYAPKILRMIGLALLEFGIALWDCFRGLYEKQNFLKEMAFVPARVVVCIMLREAIRMRVLLDIEQGVRVIHANFLGYDEQAHRRGPDAAFAHWTLLGIDRAIRDIYRSAGRSSYRDYELIVYSDHGQERSIPYVKQHGRELSDAIREAFSDGPLGDLEIWTGHLPQSVGQTMDRVRNLIHSNSMSRNSKMVTQPLGEIILTAMGPLGHLYIPSPLPCDGIVSHARKLVDQAKVPLVLLRESDGNVKAFNRAGNWNLPADQSAVLGEDHPFLQEATEDLIRLCGHEDAGDFILSGWDPTQPPITFVLENGAHGGPGTEETRGFLLVPDRIRRWHISHLANTRKRVRGEDLYHIARHFMRRDGEREEIASTSPAREKFSLRVMTYNIHSCVGIDGKIRPERIARVINSLDADVIAVQEVDAHRPRSGGQDQAQLIADHLRMTHVFHALLEKENERYGIAIFSRHPFTVVKSDSLTPAEPPRLREARGAIWVRVEPEGAEPFHFINTHFGLGRDERHRQATALLGESWLGGIPENEPVVLCGDFNSGPRSPVFQSLNTRLRDAQSLAPGHTPRATFSSIKPVLRLDHIFISHHFGVKSIELPDSPTAVMASDHLPLCVGLIAASTS